MSPKILLAEDEAHIARIVCIKLEKQGLSVEWKDNGQEAWQAAQEQTPDLILLDVNMPGLNGWQVLERLQADSKLCRVPVLMLTAQGEEGREEGLQRGATDYLSKPFRPNDLLAKVTAMLNLEPQP